MKRSILVALLIVFAVLAIVAGRIVVRSGMLVKVTPHHSGTCRAVGGVVGAEDVSIDARSMLAYLSADDRRARASGHPQRGEIYSLDLNLADSVPVPLTGGKPEDFHPHGISLWRAPDGRQRLFVINHAAHGHEVDIFEVGPGALKLLDTVTYADLASPNDLVAVGPRQFYASNDRGYPQPGLMQTLEGFLQLPASSVSYFDGRRGSLAVRGLVLANGVNRSADGRRIYVAECLGRDVRVYDRDPDSGALAERDVIPLGTCPDNIEVAEDGELWIGAHPRIFDLLAHGADASKHAPAQVLRVDPATRAVEEVYLDDGASISGVSTASVAGDKMVLGAIFDAKVLVCDRPPG